MAALTAFGPKPSGSKEQHAVPGLTCGPNFCLFSKKCIHSTCLGPRTLVITGLKWGPLRRNMRAAHLSQALPSPTPNPSGFQGFAPEMSQAGPFLKAAGVSWLKWHLPGPFPILVLLPFASCQSSLLSSVMLHGILCLSWNALGHLLALPCPTKGQAASPCPSCAWLACSQVLSGYPNISHSQNVPSSASFLIPFGFVGRGIVSGGCASSLGAQGEVG